MAPAYLSKAGVYSDNYTQPTVAFFAGVAQETRPINDAYLIFLSATYSNDYVSPETFYKVNNDVSEAYLYSKLIEIFSSIPEDLFSQKEVSFEAARIFRGFSIKGINAYFTGDESILFETFQNETYFSLEIFNDGDIVYLRRKGKNEPVAYDIGKSDLYTTINSIYHSIVY